MEQPITPKRDSVFEGVTGYHWLVILIASAGWLFDCMDQRIFVLARQPAMQELLGTNATSDLVAAFGGYATTALILGWGAGGILFGIMSDKLGRVKTMVITLFVYSGFTGLSGLSISWWDFLVYRFLVGMGVGGMFGAATTLVAESVPSGFRAVALGSLQALSAMGNMLGSLVSLWIPPGVDNLMGNFAGWRLLFFIGIIPALLVIPIMLFLREPEQWRHERELEKKGELKREAGSIKDMFSHPRWRYHAIIGLLFGVSGMVGLWGIGFFSPELIQDALKGQPQEQVDFVKSWGTLLQDGGSLLGMITFTIIATYIGRKVGFFLAFIFAMAATMFVFNSLTTATDAYWMLPLMGFAQLALFAGYSIYFPELFPTRLRGTGVGFCYNTVRFLAAPGPSMFGLLTLAMTFRTAAVVMSLVYLIGMIAVFWAPETKGQPLPEED